jgi:hypothetical protein
MARLLDLNRGIFMQTVQNFAAAASALALSFALFAITVGAPVTAVNAAPITAAVL